VIPVGQPGPKYIRAFRQTSLVADLAIIIVSYNSAAWLGPCIRSLYACGGDVQLEVVVVDNGSSDGSAELVEREFPSVRVLRGENRGFAYGNNRGFLATSAPFVLFLNPDTEILEGTWHALLEELRARPAVGLVGCRQVTPDGAVYPTIRRFPSAVRLFFEAIGAERFPFRASWLGERELDMSRYDHDVACDWTTGAFMLARREALLAAGLMDERLFMYCEEADLCLGVKRAGWEVRHLPLMTILHHAGKAGWNPRLVAQEAYARRQYLRKHFSPLHRALALAAFALGHVGRATIGRGADRRAASRAALRTLTGRRPAPFVEPPPFALAAQEAGREDAVPVAPAARSAPDDP
jgi:N-acetylglucosaminyl-diphospho-decaprenol L-rhamnosyltransferase